MNPLAATCKAINNANRIGKRSVLLRTSTNMTSAFLELMLKHQYISSLTYINDHRNNKVIVSLNGRLNKCGAICPNYNIKVSDVEGFRNRILPARQFGHLVITSTKGVIDHNTAIQEHTGGKVLGFFY
ncbi:ribosomal protein S8 [Hamiltosporidium magnivora]|nr:40S ribosomal protein S22 [Hamiltosporidium tvaerminnensis]TBU04432.1 ribosomal protein S8 [Hamiltosporidium magnivora]TBU09856.1 ribosomal protein S8 [Hamiltosporidium magnivora]